MADESLGGDGTPLVAAFTPEPFALALGMSPVGRGPADRRRPRPPPPAPAAVETHVAVGGAGLAGPPGRPPDPPPPQGRRDLGRRTARRPRHLRPGHRRPARRPRHRARTTPRTHEDRENDTRGRLGRHPHPPRRRPTSSAPPTSRPPATPWSSKSSTTSLRHRPPAVPRRRHQPARRPQDQSPRHPHRPTRNHRQREGQGVRAGRGPRPRTRGPRRRRDREARRRHPHQDPRLGRPPPSRHPTRPEHGPPRRHRLPRPTTWMRDLVHLRDSHCIFPRCQVDARSCDLDHTIPYDENGPPGQTRPDNLAALCRRHHRAKTTGRWRYLRTPDGDYHWHGPYGTTYLVTDRGTRRLP